MATTPFHNDPANEGIADADAITRTGHDTSLHALHVVEYALAAPAPRRERTWIHRLKTAVDALAAAVDQQINDNDDSVGLLAEIALTQPEHIDTVVKLRNEQRALRVAIASMREQLDDHPELPLNATQIRHQFTELANRYRQHHAREAELIHAALAIDITQPSERPLD